MGKVKRERKCEKEKRRGVVGGFECQRICKIKSKKMADILAVKLFSKSNDP